MQKLLKPKWLFLLFWGIVVLASIVILPNITTFVSEQTIMPQNQRTSAKYQQQWGHGLTDTRSLTLVFNNPNGQLTKTQHHQISTILSRLNQKADTYGLVQLRTATSMTNDRQLLRSNDGSTELALAAVQVSRTDLPIIANQLNTAIAANNLTTSVTSSDLLYQQHVLRQAHTLIVVYLIGTTLTLLILGLIFRSLLVPLLNLGCQAVTLITTISFIANSHLAWHWPLTANALGLAGLVSLLLTPILTWAFMRTYWQSIADTIPEVTGLKILAIHFRQWSLTLIPLITITLMAHWTAFITLASAWTITVALMITLLAVPTLNAAFVSWLGDSLFWPGTETWQPRSHNLWGQVSRFSYWQPALGLLISAILITPGLMIANRQFADDNLRPWQPTHLTNAELGQQLVQAHFGIGATGPITITLHSTQALTHQRAVQTIDQLTSKLQAVPNVSQVISVTRPTGQPITNFYVNNQLAAINADLIGKQTSVAQLQRQLTTDQETLKQAATSQHTQSVDYLSDRINDLANLNDQIADRLKSIDKLLTQVAAPSTTTAQLRREMVKLDLLTNRATTALNHVVNAQTSVATEAGYVNQHVKLVTESLKQTTEPFKALLTSLKTTHDYLESLAASQVGHSFYLPTTAITNQAYQNSLFTNVSSDLKMTQLIVILKSAPDAPASRQTLRQLESITHDNLLATPLEAVKISTSGITAQQQVRHQLVNQHALKWTVGIIGILIILIWIELRSFLLSALLTSGLVVLMITSWGWTQLIMIQWQHSGLLSSTVFLGSLVLLTLHWLMITLITVDRQNWFHNFDGHRLQTHFYICGQIVWPITLLECSYLLPLGLTIAPNLKALALMSLIGISLSNLIVPATLPGLIRWTIDFPRWSQLVKRRTS
ncbi:MMPL family transporter [Lactiplantibacillus sp. DA1]|uniref:MMPL family transporter n=1 Tax=Lactiplantibacillus sp. DA1 TaxID=3079857 RepID=UPI00292A665F|nr:MMPL family transporter [Lactiplantibacillus sp. DA1]MDV0431469.1 MMPL family transporter [Lactiplantibacillus sp. DA1]